MIVYDDANPRQKAQTEFMIPVKRNEFAPVFSETIYTKSISEGYPLGTKIIQVIASDQDEVCILPTSVYVLNTETSLI